VLAGVACMFPILSVIFNPLGKISIKYYISRKVTIMIVIVGNVDVYCFIVNSG